MTELEALAESLASAVLDHDYSAAASLAQTYTVRARNARQEAGR